MTFLRTFWAIFLWSFLPAIIPCNCNISFVKVRFLKSNYGSIQPITVNTFRDGLDYRNFFNLLPIFFLYSPQYKSTWCDLLILYWFQFIFLDLNSYPSKNIFHNVSRLLTSSIIGLVLHFFNYEFSNSAAFNVRSDHILDAFS